jgi:N-acetylmuramoyl-L-alanine amidase
MADGATNAAGGVAPALADNTGVTLTTEPPVVLPSLDELGDLPPALITPTGIVVPVVGPHELGYLVHSPCGNEVPLVWGQPLAQADVVIDAGHGGDEQGALGPSGETEAELNLDIARRTATVLERAGVSVALTRTGDYRIPIRFRAAIADQLEAEVFVSIHHNSPTPTPGPTDGPGTEVYVQAASEASRRLGGLLHEEITRTLSTFDADWARRDDAGVLTVVNESGEDAYGINRYASTPSALAELAYLSNPTEAVVLSTSEYRQAAAEAVAVAIVRFLETTDEGSGHVDQPRLFTPAGDTGGRDGCIDPPLE